MGPHILEFNPARILPLVRTCAWPFQGQGHTRLTLNGHPSELHVPKKHHAVRSPVLHRVREDVDVHEGAPGLTGSELAQLPVRVAQAEGGLSCVRARPEKFKFELCLQCARARRNFGFGSKARLPDTEISIAVGAKL